MTAGLALVALWLLVVVGTVGVSAARAAIRYRHVPEPAAPWVRLVRQAVLTDGEWTDGGAVVWRGVDGWWHLEEPGLGALHVPPGEVQGELQALYWRRVSAASLEAREGRGGVA